MVRPNSLSTLARAAAAASAASSSVVTALSLRALFHVGRRFVHGDAHVVDHANDIFDLLGFNDAVGQMVIDLRVGQETLLLTFCNQLF